MATYLTADGDTNALVAQVIDARHPELKQHGVTVRTLFAYAPTDERTGLPKGAALKQSGVPVVVLAKVNPLRERVQGLSDCTLQLDGLWWKDADDLARIAALDLGLRQVEIACDENGAPKLDDALRPKLHKRPADFYAAGYVDVIARNGERALELRALRQAVRIAEDALIGFAPATAPAPSPDAEVA